MEESVKALLKKYLQGDCSPEELRRVRELLAAEDSDGKLDDLMTELYAGKWGNPGQWSTAHPAIDVERIRQQLAMRAEATLTNEGERQPGAVIRSIAKMFRQWKYAAIWAGILLLGSLLYFQFRKNERSSAPMAFIEKINAGNQLLPYLLPDSSVVYLGAGATIRYGEDYGKEKRELVLNGQAFFKVTHDRSRPFTVITDSVHTTVLGTSFKVDAFPGQPLVVAVATGKVAVDRVSEGSKQALALLTPGRKVTWDAATRKATEGQVEIYGLEQWAAGELVFDEQPLGVVFRELEKRYRWTIKIVGADALEDYRVSGTFSAGEPIRQVMKVLSHSGNFTYQPKGDSIYLVTKTGRTE